MDEYIRKEEIVKKIKSCISTADDAWESGYNTAMAEIMEYIKHIPAADVELLKHGRWINRGDYSTCTVCGGSSGTQYDGVEPIPRLTPYCPNCFAKMDLKDGDSE